MTTSIRTWPDSLFYLSRAGTANVLEQIKKTQLSAELLRVLSDASTVDTNGDNLQDRLLGTSYGDLNQRHKWRVLYDNSNDRFLVQRNTGTDASKVWSERFRIDASGNVTLTGSLTTTSSATTGPLDMGGDLDMNQFYIRNAEDIQTETIRVTGQSTFQNNHGLAWVYITSKTASNSPVIDFTGLTNYPRYMVTLENVIPGTDAVSLSMRVSATNGATYNEGAIYSTSGAADSFPASALIFTSGATSWALIGGATQDNAALSALTGTVDILSMGATGPPAVSTRMRAECGWVESTGVLFVQTRLMGTTTSTGAINAIRFLYSSGVISSGTFRLYGLRNT